MPWPQIRGYLIGLVVVVLKATVGMSKTHTHALSLTHTQIMCFLPVKNSNQSVQISYGLQLWTAGLSCVSHDQSHVLTWLTHTHAHIHTVYRCVQPTFSFQFLYYLTTFQKNNVIKQFCLIMSTFIFDTYLTLLLLKAAIIHIFITMFQMTL